MQNLNQITKEIREAPDLQEVEIIEANPDGLRLYFKPGTQRTGAELLAVQQILFDYKIYNFIKMEKAAPFENEIKEISISIY